MSSSNRTFVMGITGASGARYAIRLLDVLLTAGHEVQLAISPSGAAVLKHELGREVNDLRWGALMGDELPRSGTVKFYDHQDYMSPMASGSAKSDGMIVCPCSGGTLSAIAHAASGNLIHRAADVHLKERRKLILVTREAPLSLPQIDCMRKCVEAGATVLPAAPGFYNNPQTIDDLVDFVVARICDQLNVEHDLMKRWGEK